MNDSLITVSEAAIAKPNPAHPPPRRFRIAATALLSLSIALLAGIGAAATGWLAVDAGSADACEENNAAAEHIAGAIGVGIAPLWNSESRELDASIARFARYADLRAVEVRDSEGRVRCAWPTAEAGDRIRAASPVVHEANVLTEAGERVGAVRVFLKGPSSSNQWAALWLAAFGALFTGAICALFATLTLRRLLRASRAIERGLAEYARGVESELLSLTVSDALGDAATGWNQILSETVGLRQEIQMRKEMEKTGAILGRFDSAVFRKLLDRLPLGVIRVAKEGRVRYANAAAGALLVPAGGSLPDADVNDVIKDDAIRQSLIGAAEGTHGGQSFDRSFREGERESSLRFQILPAQDGADGETLLLVEDLGPLRELERTRDNFLYHITHELRTPLTNIRAYVETLTKPDFDDEQTRKECYNVIVSETQRLSRLIEDVLSHSQLEVGSLRLELGEVDLARLLRQVVQDNLGAADEKQLNLTLRLPPKTPKLRADKQRLTVLLSNLVGNAVKYTPAGGRVNVALDVEDGAVRIGVTDTGIGIDQADQPRVFDKFYRAANSAVQSVTGTGLGLAIAREIARMHGGDIALTSELGKGSTFTLTLPLATAPRAEVVR
ncbi:MAG: ATP-binding protein [Phycisphaerae bacterium]